MDDDKLTAAHQRLLDEISADAGETAFYTGRERFSDAVMAAMKAVPRHRFVRPSDSGFAYINRPLSIGFGQTISQPYMVAVMAELLNLEPDHRVLEIGTGCGYQAAVLAEIAGQVFTIERVPELAAAAGERLAQLGYDTIRVRHGDGYLGWPEEAPFDALIATAAPERIPPALTGQLKAGGRLVIPVGRPYQSQTLMVGVKHDDGSIETRASLPVAFVPMVKGAGSERKS